MKISLKEARRIERRIESKLKMNIDFRSEIGIYEDISAEFVLAAARKKTEDTILNVVALTNARCTIRRSIQEANELSGVNSLISLREQLIRVGNIWAEVVMADTGEVSAEALLKMVDVKIERSKSGAAGYHTDSVGFNAITAEVVVEASKEKHLAQKQLDVCDDKIAAKNATVSIEVSADIEALLIQNNII